MTTSEAKSDNTPRAGLYQRITDEIIAQLERGTIPWHKPWRTDRPQEYVTKPLRYSGEPYRGINVVSLWMAAAACGYTSPYWMTYRQAAELGGQVRKGEKGSLVVFASSLTKKDEPDAAAADAEAESGERRFHFMKGYSVFNVAQIEGLPERYTLQASAQLIDIPARDAKADSFFARIDAEIRHGGAEAYYSPQGDYIQMPPWECFPDAASYYATRAHETVHWTSHEKRLNRRFPNDKRFGSNGYAMEELVAELGAAFLSVDLQVTPDLRPDHAPYIEYWLDVLENDNRAIFTAAAHAQRACDWLHQVNLPDAS